MHEIIPLILEMGKRDNVMPIRDRLWKRDLSDGWSFVLNGNKDEVNRIPPNGLLIIHNSQILGLVELNSCKCNIPEIYIQKFKDIIMDMKKTEYLSYIKRLLGDRIC